MSTCTTHHCPLYLFLLLLCLLSLHACSARRLAGVDDPNKSSEKLHFTNKGTDVNITVVPKVKSFSSSKPVLEVTEGSEITVETEPDSDDSTREESPKRYHTKATPNVKNVSSRKRKGSTSSSSSAADQKSKTRSDQHVSVSWRVPRNKRGIQKQPGFNLDYSPPKTHPPSHN
ncbi:root meristem growth factor 10 [Rosa rugosa]|uniref:root meristem growth factor 10 n=1 Tax=Rosa rugosa TaxID=74645 RepID=UPI002B413419|nr:root meristem growth factor 10 [Rosa rugosa]